MSSAALYWYLSIFGWLFLTGIGLPPVPEEAGILYAASVASLHPETWWPFAWIACGLGIICADAVLYGIGRLWGVKLFEYRWVQKVINTQRRERIETGFKEHGMKLLLAARFLPPLRTGVFLIAGATRYSFLKFFIADLIYAVVGVGLLFCFGAGLVHLVKSFESTAVVVGAALLIVFALYWYYRVLRRRESAGAPQSVLALLPASTGSDTGENAAATTPRDPSQQAGTVPGR
jgi:membrane protein DedA with SNARE-associated domain